MIAKSIIGVAMAAGAIWSPAIAQDKLDQPTAVVSCGNLLGSGSVRITVDGVVYVVYIRCGVSI